ncbi:hypothetical protein ACRQ5Q_11515 [Bradyrhizobium sp. PMVTL-01]|uniref:hypothetical protein n=1 Tax=Bradyrhizobium sp. PMVTL-01 TaxID=3434999 RepID=UPI003F6F8861
MNLIKLYVRQFAEKYADAHGAQHLAELARTAKAIPPAVLASLTAKIAGLEACAVNWTLATLAEKIAEGHTNYGDATGFAQVLERDLEWPELMELAAVEVERKKREHLH